MPFRNEPLRLSVERRVEMERPREGFTDSARSALINTVLPAVARYGFDRLWMELHRDKARGSHVTRDVERAEAVLRWQRDRETLTQMDADGLVEFDRVGFHEGTAFTVEQRDSPGLQRAVAYDGTVCWQRVISRAVVDGDHVGWLDDHGRLIPLGTDLAEVW